MSDQHVLFLVAWLGTGAAALLFGAFGVGLAKRRLHVAGQAGAGDEFIAA
jgi:hypothetical protein